MTTATLLTQVTSPPQPLSLAGLSAALARTPGMAAGDDRLYVPPGAGQQLVRRILVLVPHAAGLETELAQRAWQLAIAAGAPLVLVGLAHDSATEAQARRQLASLAALTRGEGVAVTTRVAPAQDWLPVLRRLWEPGDLVLCLTGQAAGGWLGLRRQPLPQALAAALHAPFYQARLSGEARADPRLPRPLVEALAWMSAFGVIITLFWVQAQVVRLTQGLIQSALLLVSVGVEFALIKLIGHW